MKIKIIYHEVKRGVPCPDGLASAWVAHKKYPQADLFGCCYQCPPEDLPPVNAGDRLIIVDFSFPHDLLAQWETMGCEIELYDHHKTAQALLGDTKTLSSRIIFDQTECGATLVFKSLFPDSKRPIFLDYIKDRDLWNKELPFSDEIHTAIGALGRSFELFDVLEKLTFIELHVLGRLGEALLIKKRQQISAIADRATQGYFYGVLNIPVVELSDHEDYLVSDLCEELYRNRYPTALFVAVRASTGTWSLRSNKTHADGGFDVGAFAKRLGGGGHRNAAGFSPTTLGWN